MIKRLVSQQSREKIEAVQERIELKWMNRKKGKGPGLGLILALIVVGGGLAFWMLSDKTKELKRVTLAMTTDRGMEPTGTLIENKTISPDLSEDLQARFEIQRKQIPDYERTGVVSKQYRKLERQEILSEVIRQAPNRKLEVGEDKPPPTTTHIYDKDLVLAGRGYEIGRFQKEAQLQLKLNSVHIPEPYLIEQAGSPQHSKAQGTLTEAREHSFVLHSRATGFHTGYNVASFKKGKQVAPPPLKPVKPIPETRLRLDVGKKSELHLIPHKDRLDLLRGDPNINRYLYKKRFGKSVLPVKTVTTGSNKKSTKTRQ